MTTIIFDTDPGVDDTFAILLGLSSPELSVDALLTVCGNVPLEIATRNALQILALADRSEVPVYAGAERPMLGAPLYGRHHGRDGLGGASLPPPRATQCEQHAVEYLIDRLESARNKGERVTVCALGPLTNIALALSIRPHVADGIARIIAMGGAFRTPGNRTFTSEFNILADPYAAQVVFSTDIPITLLPLDATHQAMATPRRVEQLQSIGGPLMEVLGPMLKGWDRKDIKRYGTPGGPMHDPLVTAFVLAPHLFESEPARVVVETESALCRGQTVADWFGESDRPANVDIVTRVDTDGFFGLLEMQLRHLSAVTA